jgi:diguanylate cyclase (GGDEF)-like protein/PAS domain S-box-containing protein
VRGIDKNNAIHEMTERATRRWGIRARVLFLALVPLTVIVLLLALHFIWSRISDMDRELQDRGRAIARQLAPACEYGVISGNRDILAKLAQSALREADVLSATITDARGNVLAAAAAGSQDAHELPPQTTYVFRAPVVISTVAIDEALDPAGVPQAGASESTHQIGWVAVQLSAAATEAQQQRILIQSLIITLIGLATTTLIALHMARGVTRPILALTATVGRIKDGAFDERVVVQSSAELGQLEVGVNAMAAALEEARAREKKGAEDALFLEKVRAQVTLESIGDGVITTDSEGMVVYMNPAAEQFLGWTQAGARGLPLSDVFRLVDEDGSPRDPYPVARCLHEGRVLRHDSHQLLARQDGHRIEIHDTAAPIRDRDGTILGAVVVFRDVTEIQHMARRMAFLASHDPLTGLLNRREFENRLHLVLESARSQGTNHAVCYLDLDQFKIVNDTCGHVAGDELLKHLAHHLAREIRASDLFARLGGDEFGVILENCSMEKAQQIGELLRQSIRDYRFVWAGRTFEVGVSIGLVPVNADSGGLTDILSAADSACYVAKDRGRNRIHVYQPDDVALAQRHGEMQWVHRLRSGLANNNFDLHCQAIVPLHNKGPVAAPFYEVLVRIHDHDLVMPTVFIPAAERYHLMPLIDRWVVYTSFNMLQRYFARARRRPGAVSARFAINLSGQSLGDEKFLDFVAAQFAQTRIEPGNICFEITETAAIANLARARQFIARFKTMGCQFALDDFGSGLSSFGYLKSLPVDYLKIAGDFIQDIIEDPVDLAMVDAINQIGHVMGILTVAESVENAATLARLREAGVDYVQGLGIDSPKPMHEVLMLSEAEWQNVRSRANVVAS